MSGVPSLISQTANLSLLPPSHQAAVVEFRGWVWARFGKRLESIRLFGSFVRGDASEESDVDIFIMVRDLTAEERWQVGEEAGNVLTRHGTVISPLAVSSHQWTDLRRKEKLIVAEVEQGGVEI